MVWFTRYLVTFVLGLELWAASLTLEIAIEPNHRQNYLATLRELFHVHVKSNPIPLTLCISTNITEYLRPERMIAAGLALICEVQSSVLPKVRAGVSRCQAGCGPLDTDSLTAVSGEPCRPLFSPGTPFYMINHGISPSSCETTPSAFHIFTQKTFSMHEETLCRSSPRHQTYLWHARTLGVLGTSRSI